MSLIEKFQRAVRLGLADIEERRQEQRLTEARQFWSNMKDAQRWIDNTLPIIIRATIAKREYRLTLIGPNAVPQKELQPFVRQELINHGITVTDVQQNPHTGRITECLLDLKQFTEGRQGNEEEDHPALG